MRSIKGMILLGISLGLVACSISVNLTDTPAPSAPSTATPFPLEVATDEPFVPLPSEIPSTNATPQKTITVYFTNEARFVVGTLPFEDPVIRPLPEGAEPMRAVLDALFAGPTDEEYTQGLRLFSSGFTGVREFTVENGIARIYLEGKCANNGAAYSVASVIGRNLEQFSEITAVKIYDENNSNLDPDSNTSSLPYCLEP